MCVIQNYLQITKNFQLKLQKLNLTSLKYDNWVAYRNRRLKVWSQVRIDMAENVIKIILSFFLSTFQNDFFSSWLPKVFVG